MKSKLNFYCSLTFTFLVSISALTSCKKKVEDSVPEREHTFVTDEELDDITKHEAEIKEGETKLISSGLTDYCVIYPKSLAQDGNMVIAIAEFKNLFSEATGIDINFKTDDVETRTNKIISIGQTNQAMNNSALMETFRGNELGTNGYVIKTIGDSVYMLGNKTIADLYSVYEFFKYQFGFENYASDEYFIEHDIRDLNLLNINVVDVPDFDARTSCNMESISTRFRTISYTDGFNNADGNTFCHNYYNLVPPAQYANEHPKWFYGHGSTGQLCLEAGGDQNERLALKNVVVESLKDRLLAQPNIDWIAFCHNDGGEWCNCEYCTKGAALYDHGKNTAAFASVIRFVNLVAKDIKEWNLRECPDRDITIFIYDYSPVTWAPVKLDSNLQPVLDSNGNYLPYSDDLVLESNVAIYWCGYASATSQLSLNDPSNLLLYEQLRRSQAVMSNPIRYIWTYSTNFGCYFLPYNSIWTRQERYKLFKKFGAKGVFDQAQFDNSKSSDFGALKSYISAKMLWNCRLDVNQLINDFMKHYFGKASDTMLEMLAQYSSYITDIIENRGYGGKGVTYLSDKYFKYGEIQFFKEYINRAFRDIEELKDTDYASYKKYYDRINKESLVWRFLEISIYPNYFTFDKLTELQNQFVTDALTLGITKAGENNAISNIFG